MKCENIERNELLVKIKVIKDAIWKANNAYVKGEKSNTENWDWLKLQYAMHQHLLIQKKDSLLFAQQALPIKALPHQIETVKKVVFHMHGRAIIADEVGLGKTITAGMIIKEYMSRKQIKKILILVPSALKHQWASELIEKFRLPVTVFKKNYDWKEAQIMIASIDIAKQDKHMKVLCNISYDLLIVDEAHLLKNKKTKNYKLVNQLKARFCLLLTATPMQNNISELLNIISIIDPVRAQILHFHYKNKDKVGWKETLEQVFIRNERKALVENNMQRNVEIKWVSFSKEEQALYKMLKHLIKKHPTKVVQQHYMKAFCSSREACYLSLQRATESFSLLSKTVQRKLEQLDHHSKAKALLQFIQHKKDKKILIFTQYFATQYYLIHFLQMHHIPVIGITGKMRPRQKEWAIHRFEHEVHILIATEAAQEGLNMQFCHHLVNYDLPWNPLKIEQRIGRINRIGQDKSLEIYHFLMKDSMEEKMIDTLKGKIDTFEEHIGDLEKIVQIERGERNVQ